MSSLSLAVWPALFLASADMSVGETGAPFLLAQGGDCYAIGESVAAQNGGELAAASEARQNGQPVCQIIIVVRGQNGERPRRMEIIVPKG
ncbi:MAG: hypothetical protein MUC58_11600 [Rhizobiaceae bacterium]|nr:hypothetical protein [Rhizobiaceae bacterium]